MPPFCPAPFRLLSLALLASSAVVRATSSAAVPAEPWVAEIVANNPELRFYEAEVDAAKARRRAAGALADPELALEAGRKRVRDAAGALAGEGTVWSVSLTQTFEWPGRLALRKAIANRQVELAELGLLRFRTALASRARLLGYALQVAGEKAAATREVAARYQVLRETFLARDPAGLTPRLETRVIEAQELVLQRRATEAELAVRTARAQWNQLRGLPLDTPLPPVASKVVFHPPPPLETLLPAAREGNFEYRLRRLELVQQGLEVSLARNERYPAVSISPFFSQENADERESVVGVGVSVPLPLHAGSRAGVELGEAKRRQAQAALALAEREMQREVVAAFDRFEAALAATASWQPDAVAKFREAAELADRHYRLGAVPLATYLELQGAYLDAVEAILDTRRDALDAGQQLQLLTGVDFNAVELTP